MTNGHTGQDGAIRAEPDIVADHHVATAAGVIRDMSGFVKECRERVGADPVAAVGATQEDLYVFSYGAVFPDSQCRFVMPVMDYGNTITVVTKFEIRIQSTEFFM